MFGFSTLFTFSFRSLLILFHFHSIELKSNIQQRRANYGNFSESFKALEKSITSNFSGLPCVPIRCFLLRCSFDSVRFAHACISYAFFFNTLNSSVRPTNKWIELKMTITCHVWHIDGVDLKHRLHIKLNCSFAIRFDGLILFAHCFSISKLFRNYVIRNCCGWREGTRRGDRERKWISARGNTSFLPE